MQSSAGKLLVVASISRIEGDLRVIKEVEVDLDGALARRWGTRADDVRVKRTMAALEANGVRVVRASDGAAAKRLVLDLIPDASPVHQGASQTLDVLGITYEIEKSGRYAALRPRIWSMDRETEAREIRRLGAAPEVMLGSVHAVTETGSLLAASMSGSHLAPLPAAPDESFSSSGRRRSCPTSRKVFSASTNMRIGSETAAPRLRTAYAAR